jgi:hypothetical protein
VPNIDRAFATFAEIAFGASRRNSERFVDSYAGAMRHLGINRLEDGSADADADADRAAQRPISI